MLRYLRLLGIQMRASALVSMQYRLDFVLDALSSFYWAAGGVMPLFVMFGQRTRVAGWTWPEALVVVAFFTLLKGVLEVAIQPSLSNVIEHIRKGTLDFILIKPVDAQFMVSTSRFELFKASNMIGGVVLLIWAMHLVGRWPSPLGLLLTATLLLSSALILHSIWILVVSLAFFVVKIDNLVFLFASIYDAARYPSSVFRGALSILFTFVIPLAVMTTFPALALLGKLGPMQAAGAFGGSILFALAARTLWLRALRHYTSAGG